MMGSLISWFLFYSPIVQLFVTTALTILLAVFTIKQYRLNRIAVLRPDWKVNNIELGGDKEECSGTIYMENIEGEGRDISIQWVVCHGDYNGDRMPKAECLRDPETTLRKTAHPGDVIKIPVKLENIDKIDYITINVNSEEISDLTNIYSEKLIESIK